MFPLQEAIFAHLKAHELTKFYAITENGMASLPFVRIGTAFGTSISNEVRSHFVQFDVFTDALLGNMVVSQMADNIGRVMQTFAPDLSDKGFHATCKPILDLYTISRELDTETKQSVYHAVLQFKFYLQNLTYKTEKQYGSTE